MSIALSRFRALSRRVPSDKPPIATSPPSDLATTALKYRLVILDFDGTLADSLGWLARNINDVARRYRFRAISPEEGEALRSADSLEIIRYLGVPTWKIPFIARHMRKLAAKDAAEISLFAGAADLLARLRSRGIALALVSSNSEANVRAVLGPANAGLFDYFACGASIFGKAAKFR